MHAYKSHKFYIAYVDKTLLLHVAGEAYAAIKPTNLSLSPSPQQINDAIINADYSTKNSESIYILNIGSSKFVL